MSRIFSLKERFGLSVTELINLLVIEIWLGQLQLVHGSEAEKDHWTIPQNRNTVRISQKLLLGIGVGSRFQI